MAEGFPYKTPPLYHQRRILKEMAPQPFWGWFCEQGTGKTFIALCNAAWLFLKGKITAALAIAPNGVHLNWANDEIPQHWPESVPITVWVWDVSKAEQPAYRKRFKETVKTAQFPFLCISVTAIGTKWGYNACEYLLKRRPTIAMVDESTDIKSPSSKRGRAARRLGRLAPYRRVLTGTPSGDGNPLDLYGQCTFLDKRVLNFSSFKPYKNFVGEWEERERETIDDSGEETTVRTYQYQVIKRNPDGSPMWKNLDVIQRRLARYSSRVTKDECLDLPPKIYAKRYCTLSPQQQAAYDELVAEYMLELPEHTVYAELAIVRLLRLQQIACGYVGVGIDEPEYEIPGPQPRIAALKTWAEEQQDHAFIVWARFTKDLDKICDALRELDIDYGRYDGTIKALDREATKNDFQAGRIQALVANASAAGRGLTLTAAHAMLYYSNQYGLEVRQHSEDRPHRVGLRHSVTIADLIAIGTVDQKIVGALRAKRNVADTLTGDPRKDWI